MNGVREFAKAAARFVAAVIVVPELLSFHVRALLIGPDRALQGSSQLLGLIPGLTGQYLRRAFLGFVLERCDPTASIGFGTLFSKTGARIGPRVYIGAYCHLGWVELEADVLLASGVHITSGARIHGTSDPAVPIRDQEGELLRVRIGAGAWIGSAAVVMADVGANSVVGAGSVVTHPIPDNVAAAGVPARVLRSRLPEPAEATSPFPGT